MRLKPTQDNLVVQLEANEVADTVQAAIRLLVPRYTNKVYFLAGSNELPVPNVDGAVVVHQGSEPSNFLQSFRLILNQGQLFIVSSKCHRFTLAEWRNFAEELKSCAT